MARDDVSIEVDVSEALLMLSTMEPKIRRRCVTAASRAGGNEILKRSRAEAPSRTGMMRKQLRLSMKFDGRKGLVTARVWPKATKSQRRKGHRPRGPIVHLVAAGTKPHTISGPISFNGQVFAAAHHPGSRANPFQDRAARAAYSPAVAAFRRRFFAKIEEEKAKA